MCPLSAASHRFVQFSFFLHRELSVIVGRFLRSPDLAAPDNENFSYSAECIRVRARAREIGGRVSRATWRDKTTVEKLVIPARGKLIYK